MRLLDSFAWIEYFIGSNRGAKVKNYVEGTEPLYTPSICLTEIKSRYLREQRDPTTRLEFIIERSFIIPLDTEIALLAAEMKQKYKLHTVDAIIYATSQHRQLPLVTGDVHFKGLPNVEFI
ncbi:type II toxin-antitoxin system VapC family toxin [Candidatus Bathyarchaeota archaeon]|nr:type II toxin-antitoxin system VapC family toxin [Candidatus Bathyarchaeota archaeon]